MNNSQHKLIALPLLVGLLAPLSLTATASAQTKKVQDVILRKADKPLRNVEVLEANVDKIKYKKGGTESEIAASKVSQIQWHEPPDAFAKAAAAERRGRYQDAGNLYLAAAKASKRVALQLEAKFRAGRAYLAGAGSNQEKANAAAAAIETYLQDAPKGLHVPEAQLILAKVKLQTGDPAGADAILQQMETDGSNGGWPMRWTAYAQFERGRALLAQGKHGDARRAYESAKSTVDVALGEDSRFNRELKSLQAESRVMVGETYIQEKLLDAAKDHFRSLATEEGTGVKAAGAAGVGQILYLEGVQKKDGRLLRQAQMELAKAAIEIDTTRSISAKALFYMGKVLQALGDQETNSLTRARTYFESVRSSYPKTTWAEKARQELSGG